MGKRLRRAWGRRLARHSSGGIRSLLGVISLLLMLCLVRSSPLDAFPAQRPSPAAPPGSLERQPDALLGQVVIFEDHFESDLGWERDVLSEDTATDGLWERAIAKAVSDAYGNTQIAAYDGQYDLVTNSLAGSTPSQYDVDGGVTSICSPKIQLPSGTWDSIELSFYYYLAHRTNSTTADGLEIQVVGLSVDTVVEEHGSADNDNAAWQLYSGSMVGLAGQEVYLCLYAVDGFTDSTVEAGFDAVQIVASESTPPSSTASSPDYDNGGTIPVSFSASDGASGVDETCLWFMYETAGWTYSGMCAGGTAGTFYFSPSSGDGTYYFQTVAVDNAGNMESTPSGGGDDRTFRDTVDPTATVASPPLTSSSSWLVSWTGSDPSPASGVAAYDVQYKVDSAPTWTDWLLATTGTSATFGPDSPVVVAPGHTYSFQVRAYDLADNVGDYSTAASTDYQALEVYLPLTVNAYSALTNGSFEYGWTGWTHGGSIAQTLTTADSYEGSYAALLGDPGLPCAEDVAVGGTAWTEQTFSVPAGGVSALVVHYQVVSYDTAAFDRFEIWVNGTLVLTDGNASGNHGCEGGGPWTAGWEEFQLPLASYLGQNVTLRLVNVLETDRWFNTWTYVDDVRLLP